MKTLKILALTITLFSFVSCEKNDAPKEIIGNVDIFLLKSYDSESTYGKINQKSAKLYSEPLIPYSEIIAYNKTNHCFELSEQIIDTIQGQMPLLIGSAFAVTANQEIIYTGFFWSELFSSICGWNAIIGAESFTNKEFSLAVKLGYPEHLVSVPDKRNDSKITNIFQRDDKLIE